VKCLVEPESRIDVARELIRLRDDRFQSRAHERVTMGLAAGQRTRVAAQERQVGR